MGIVNIYIMNSSVGAHAVRCKLFPYELLQR